MNLETEIAVKALTTPPQLKDEIRKVLADVEEEDEDPDRHDAAETLREGAEARYREEEDPYGIKHLRLEMVDWYAVVDALESG